jgi:hypothetical protein
MIWKKEKFIHQKKLHLWEYRVPNEKSSEQLIWLQGWKELRHTPENHRELPTLAYLSQEIGGE